MERFENAIGIDVSKSTLDVYDYKKQSYTQLSNVEKGFKQLVKWMNSNNDNAVIVCFEHTGLYSLPLAIFLTESNIPFCMVAGLEVKRSLGIKRGKIGSPKR